MMNVVDEQTNSDNMTKELVMYSRTIGCPFVTLARDILEQHQISYREIFIDRDDTARARVLAWTGFLSVPTLVIAEPGADLPYEEPEPLDAGVSPRGIDRGAMLTEPNASQLLSWLRNHGMVTEQTGTSS